MATINVILLKSMKKSGKTCQAGEVIPVRMGHFRYLEKAGFACHATQAELANLEERKKLLTRQDEEEQERAAAILNRLADETFLLMREAGDNEVLYGSVTVSDIVGLLEEKGVSVRRTQVNITSPIKKLGTHTVTLILHPKVITSLSVKVARA